MSNIDNLADMEKWLLSDLSDLRGEIYATRLLAISALGLLLSDAPDYLKILEALEDDLGRSIDAVKIVDGGEPYDSKLRETARFHVNKSLDEIRRRLAGQ